MAGERRKYLRVLFEETIEVRATEWTDSMATGLDISLNGTRFHCEHPLSEGESITVRLQNGLELQGEIRWCWPIEWYYQAALEFFDLNEKQQLQLRDYISEVTGEPYPDYSEAASDEGESEEDLSEELEEIEIPEGDLEEIEIPEMDLNDEVDFDEEEVSFESDSEEDSSEMEDSDEEVSFESEESSESEEVTFESDEESLEMAPDEEVSFESEEESLEMDTSSEELSVETEEDGSLEVDSADENQEDIDSSAMEEEALLEEEVLDEEPSIEAESPSENPVVYLGLNPTTFSGKHLVLLQLEDDHAEILSRYLKVRNGFEVTVVKKRGNLWPLLKSKPAELVIMGWNRDGSSAEIFGEFRVNAIHLPVIFLSGPTTLEDRLNALNEGAVDFLSRPIHVAMISQRVLQYFGNASASAKEGEAVVVDNEALELESEIQF